MDSPKKDDVVTMVDVLNEEKGKLLLKSPAKSFINLTEKFL